MFPYSAWMEIPFHLRIKVASLFDVVKKRSTHVVNGRVESDGYDIKDIEGILVKLYEKKRDVPLLEVIYLEIDEREQGKPPETTIDSLPRKRTRKPNGKKAKTNIQK